MPKSQYTIEILLRGLNILALFARENPTLSLTEIASITGLNKTTVFRLLNTLEEAGYLLRDLGTKRYRPGIKVLKLGFTAITSLDFRQVAHPYLEQLSQQVNETVSMSILDAMEVVYIDRVRNQQIMGVVLGLGSRLPAHCSSMGKVMLAHLNPNELNLRLEMGSLTSLTPKSLSSPQALVTELAHVRQLGYAINDEEIEIGLRAVAAPIWDHTNLIIAAINITGLAARISLERISGELALAVCQTAHQISQALGYKSAES
jgi:PcaR/PcaU/PobR family beta-ketoadipate pathway transcriptional regulator